MKASKLTRKQVITTILETYGIDVSQGLRLKIDDHTNNPFSRYLV